MSNTHQTFAVIGAGPSGLAAASALKSAGLNVTVYDSGKTIKQRQHETAGDLAVGVGGAGLFSDGKFSFHPSGTQLYKLHDKEKLQQAYDWCRHELKTVGINSEPFPETCLKTVSSNGASGVKQYPAHYADLVQRKELIARLYATSAHAVVTETSVTAIRRSSDGYLLDIKNNRTGEVGTTTVTAVILAMGRFGSLAIHEGRLESDILLREVRYEFGIRVESHSSVGFLNKLKQPDVKRLWEHDQAQIRTFCTCREGEVWNIPCDGISALSGRSDGVPTAFSNFGLLARFEGKLASRGKELWEQLRNTALRHRIVVYEPLSSFLDGNSSVHTNGIDYSDRPWFPKEDFKRGSIREELGEPLYEILATAVRDLLEWCPELDDERTVCLFPAVEGVGFYPDLDHNLKMKNELVWSCGDIVGVFRGLIPSLVSGYYVGLKAFEAVLGEISACGSSNAS